MQVRETGRQQRALSCQINSPKRSCTSFWSSAFSSESGVGIAAASGDNVTQHLAFWGWGVGLDGEDLQCLVHDAPGVRQTQALVLTSHPSLSYKDQNCVREGGEGAMGEEGGGFRPGCRKQGGKLVVSPASLPSHLRACGSHSELDCGQQHFLPSWSEPGLRLETGQRSPARAPGCLSP